MSTTAHATAAPLEAIEPSLAAPVMAFARACRGAARVTALYPPEHPAVGTALTHVVEAARQVTAHGEIVFSVLPDDLSVGGRRLARPDAAATELAAWLHYHQVGRLTLRPHADADEWRRFLALLSLTPDQSRVRGGLAPLWATEGPAHILIEAIDYAALLIDRIRGDRATWRAVVEQCLDRDAEHCEDWMVDLILEILNHPERAGRLLAEIDERLPAAAGRGPVVVASVLRAVAEYAARTQPDQVEPLLVAMADAAGRMPLTALAPIAATRRAPGQAEMGAFVASLAARMKDADLANRLAEAVRDGHGGSSLLAETLALLVPDIDRRSSVVALAKHVIASQASAGAAGTAAQAHVGQILASHDDRPFISDTYSVELQRAADRAVDLDRDATDPPDRVRDWTASVNDDRVRQLDAQLLVDLMQMKRDLEAWQGVAALAVARVQVLVVVGDFHAAAFLVEAIRLQQEAHPVPEVREAADRTLATVLNADLMRHVASHLDTSDPSVVAAAKRVCQAIGTGMVVHLAEVLSREERSRSRQHLIGILTSFGAAGRQTVERLMQSSNSAVRRTAVQLLRAFGGHDALPKLNAMLNDEDPNVQREATRAIALLAIEPAYHALTQALVTGSGSARTAIASALWTLPADGTIGLLAHIVTEAPTGGHMTALHERVLQRLGTVGGPAAVEALTRALERGSIVAPFRTRLLRRQAAEALAAIGTPDATQALEAAASDGSRGVRAAARAALALARRGGSRTTSERRVV